MYKLHDDVWCVCVLLFCRERKTGGMKLVKKKPRRRHTDVSDHGTFKKKKEKLPLENNNFKLSTAALSFTAEGNYISFFVTQSYFYVV